MKRPSSKPIRLLLVALSFAWMPASTHAEEVLYGLNTGSETQLVRIDIHTGDMTPIADWFGGGWLRGMAYDDFRNLFYVLVDRGGNDEIYSYDPAADLWAYVGRTGFAHVWSLTYHSANDELYSFNWNSDELLRIDRNTGAATVVGQSGVYNVSGMTYDRVNDTLYAFGADTKDWKIFTIDPTTAASTPIGPTGIQFVGSIAYNVDDQQMYAVDIQLDQLVILNPSTGVPTVIGPTGISVQGLSFVETPDPLTTLADSLNVVFGTQIAGTLSDTSDSDDQRIVIQGINPFAPNLPEIRMDYTYTLPSDTPSELRIVTETQVNDIGIVREIHFFNYNTSTYEFVDSRSATLNNDSVADILIAGDVTRFVEMGTGQVQVRVETYSDGSGFQTTKLLRTDEMTLRSK